MRRARATTPILQAAERGLPVRLRHAVGLRQTFQVEGVRYRELSTQRLRHALSRQGPGFKDYEVAFASGDTLRIRATPTRHFADLTGPRLLPIFRVAESALRPGMRALIMDSGSGYTAAWVADRVAPSGAVVAVEQDRQSVDYAQRRYASPIVSFECGGLDSLAGETDAAFNAVFAVDSIRDAADPQPLLKELWRVVAPGGWLLVAIPKQGPAPAPRNPTEGDPPAAASPLTDVLAAALGALPAPSLEADSGEAPPPAPPPQPLMIRSEDQDHWSIAFVHKPPD